MKKIFALGFLLPYVCFANLPKTFLCKSEVLKSIHKVAEAQNLLWVKQHPDTNGREVYRAKIKLNHWLELKTNQKVSTLTTYSAEKYTDQKWNEICQVVVSTGEVDLFKKKSSYKIEDFNNEDLKKLIMQGQSGVIYLYSPKMTYSMSELLRLKKSITKNGYLFTALLDPDADPKDAELSAKSLNLEFKGLRMASLDLYMMNGTDHYPTLFFYSNKKLYPHKLSGVHDEKNIKTLFAEWKEELK